MEIRLALHGDDPDRGGHGRDVDGERRIVEAVGKMLGVAAHARIVLPHYAACKRPGSRPTVADTRRAPRRS